MRAGDRLSIHFKWEIFAHFAQSTADAGRRVPIRRFCSIVTIRDRMLSSQHGRVLAAFACLAASAALAGSGPRIVVDPGHGGFQEGALSADGVAEKALSLQIACQLKEALQKELDANVSLTREADSLMPLSERVAFTNRQKPDLFISLHANSMATKRQRDRIEGVETFFLSAGASGEEAGKTAARENAELSRSGSSNGSDPLSFILADLVRSEAHADSSRLAYAVHQKLVAVTGAVNRGVQQAPFYVLMGVEAPAILVEMGFISHPVEGKRLQDPAYQQRIASAIAQGVKVFVDQTRNVTRGATLTDQGGR